MFKMIQAIAFCALTATVGLLAFDKYELQINEVLKQTGLKETIVQVQESVLL